MEIFRYFLNRYIKVKDLHNLIPKSLKKEGREKTVIPREQQMTTFRLLSNPHIILMKYALIAFLFVFGGVSCSSRWVITYDDQPRNLSEVAVLEIPSLSDAVCVEKVERISDRNDGNNILYTDPNPSLFARGFIYPPKYLELEPGEYEIEVSYYKRSDFHKTITVGKPLTRRIDAKPGYRYRLWESTSKDMFLNEYWNVKINEDKMSPETFLRLEKEREPYIKN